MIKDIKGKTIEFIKHGMWKPEYRSKNMNRLIKEIRVFYFTFMNYTRHGVTTQSAALTFYTMMAIVPILAMILGIAKGFGVEDYITSIVNDNLSEYKEFTTQISLFADAYLSKSNVGLFAGISIFVLLWSVIMVFNNIESAFNHVWDIKKSRNYPRKISDYLSILFITPLVIVLFRSISIQLDSTLLKISENYEFTIWITTFTIEATKYIGTWLVLSTIYYVLPNTNVKYGATLRAAMISGTILLVFSDLYFFFQSSVSSYNAVYGGFAALPLLLVWLNLSWQIILFGTALSFAYQNISKYEHEREFVNISKSCHDKIAVVVMHLIIKNFENDNAPLSSEQIASTTNVPIGVVHDIIYDFEQANLVLSIEQPNKVRIYTLARNLSDLTIVELLSIINSIGRNYSRNESAKYIEIDSILNKLHKTITSSKDNIKIIDL